jgi:hypothetical protein
MKLRLVGEQSTVFLSAHFWQFIPLLFLFKREQRWYQREMTTRDPLKKFAVKGATW